MTPRQLAFPCLLLLFPLLAGGSALAQNVPLEGTGADASVSGATETVRVELGLLGYRYDQGSRTYTGADGKVLSAQRLKRYLAPYNYRSRPLNDEERTLLLFDGYRLEPATSHVLAPRTHKPMSNLDFDSRRAEEIVEQRRDSLERLSALVDAQDPGQPLSPLARVQAARLLKDRQMPSSVVQDVASLTALAGSVASDVHDAYLKEIQAYDGTLNSTALAVRTHPLGPANVSIPATAYFNDSEKALGAALQRETEAYLRRNSVGAELLDHFKDASGQVKLPGFAVLPIDSNAAAIYANGMVTIGQADVVDSIVYNLPRAQRRALRAKLSDSRALADYLNAHPGAIDRFFKNNDVTIAHELTHAWQHRREPFWSESERGNFPDGDNVELEHEAFLLEMRYLHEKLKAHPDALVTDDEELERYQRFTADLDGWRDGITQTYLETWPQEAMTLASAEQFQKERIKAAQELEQNPVLAAIEKLKLIAFGVGSAQEKTFQAHYDKIFDDFRKSDYPTIQKQSNALLAKTFLARAKAARDSSDRQYALEKAAQYAEASGDPDLIRRVTDPLDQAVRRLSR